MEREENKEEFVEESEVRKQRLNAADCRHNTVYDENIADLFNSARHISIRIQ